MKVNKIDKIWVLIIFVTFSIVMISLNVIERWNDTAIKITHIDSKIKTGNKYKFNVDDIKFVGGDIVFTLWFVDNSNPSSVEQYLILENMDTKQSFVIPTEIYPRQDIVDAYGDDAYLYCGMRARALKKYVDVNVDYKVYVLIENDGKNKVVDLDTTVKGWKNNEK